MTKICSLCNAAHQGLALAATERAAMAVLDAYRAHLMRDHDMSATAAMAQTESLRMMEVRG